MGIKITLDGESMTIKKLENYAKDVQDEIVKLTVTLAKQAKKAKQEAAPVYKGAPRMKRGKPLPGGNLKKSISYKSSMKGLYGAIAFPRKKRAGNTPNGYHRHLVAYGTKNRTTKKGENRGQMHDDPKFAKAGEEVVPKFEQGLKTIIDKTVKI